jgi:trehalose 6-phosphate synthase
MRVMSGVPHHRDLVEAMLAYDLIGFQTDDDRQNFADYVRREFNLRIRGDVVISGQGKARLSTFPIGIDPQMFAQYALKAASHPEVSRLRMSLQGSKLAIGVDRIDYSKGLHNRIRAFDRLLETQTSLKRQVSLLQIAVPSRGGIEAYGRLQAEVAQLVTEVNGRHGEVDWAPIRYITKGFGQAVLAGLYRTAQVGLVTPLQDGMNLVAKEYVAAQNPQDPGVLVLSRFAGAARELEEALIVNPHDIDAVAQAIGRAFAMPLEERKERWNALITRLRAHTIRDWATDFIDELAATRTTPLRQMVPNVSRLRLPFQPRAAGL